MTERSRIFDTVTPEYSAGQHIEMWRDVFRVVSGVVPTNDTRKNANNQLEVESSSGLTIIVKEGRAFIDGYWYENDAELSFTLITPDPTDRRIDRVVVELNISSKVVATKIVTGAVASIPSAPALVDTNNIKQVSLAIVDIAAGVSNIFADDITDERVYISAYADRIIYATSSEVDLGSEDQKGVSPAGLAGSRYRRIYVSDDAPTSSDGVDGDLWLEY